jgi:hypothetical protein
MRCMLRSRAVNKHMAKRILTVGLQLANDDVAEQSFMSKTSLLDWDIVLFRPNIESHIHSSDAYKGKPSLTDHSSFALKEACEHWRREIKQAVENGRTVIIFLPSVSEVYVDTGNRTYSGTGRNQRTNRLVEPYSNYAAIPIDLGPTNAAGTEMKLSRGADLLSPYWAEFGPVSNYEVLLSTKTPGICLTTKTGDRPVAAIIQNTGSLVLLPNIDFAPDEFFDEDADEEDDGWTDEAKQFANRIIHAVVALDSALRASADVTPEPDWATDPVHSLAKEQILRSELLEAERRLEAAQKEKEQIQERLQDAGNLRGLLYEKGKPLEHAIIEALQLMEFKAHPFNDATSEFDVVFESPEGRLLGEAEGKDNRAINISLKIQLLPRCKNPANVIASAIHQSTRNHRLSRR